MGLSKFWEWQRGVVIDVVNSFSGNRYGKVTPVAISPDGQHIATAFCDNFVRFWDSQTGVVRKALKGHTGWVNSVAFFPDGRRIVSASEDKTIRVWDKQASEKIFLWDRQEGVMVLGPLLGHTGAILCVTVSPSGQYLASGSQDSTLRIWDV